MTEDIEEPANFDLNNKLTAHKKQKIQESEQEPEKKYKNAKKKLKNEWEKTRQLLTGEYKPYILRQQREYQNLWSKNNEKDFTREIEYTNDESLGVKNEIIHIEPNNDETFEIKEETIKDQDNVKFCTVYVKETDNIAINELPNRRKRKIQDSKEEPEKKYKCEKCARTYKQNRNLIGHQKFECDVIPKFKCKFCDKRFKQKGQMNTHVKRVHHKTSSKTSALTHKCDKCSRSYAWFHDLTRHKRFKHGGVIPQFLFCEICGYKTNRKSTLTTHMSSRHLK
ncbi:zinc finger protein 680-like [Belonocnema kinseyi]|uniref:zinc finger protein 680-like n=1 Tax=Belonocnema kinseyi TaxID=2817044 RepID=UPI00143D0E29|nr:zinc finger protein 680-like [Belonocnema kinseyi]